MKIDKLLVTQDESNVKEFGLFLYTQEMLITILYNICIPLKLINRAKGIIAEIISDFNDKTFNSYDMSKRCVLLTLQCCS